AALHRQGAGHGPVVRQRPTGGEGQGGVSSVLAPPCFVSAQLNIVDLMAHKHDAGRSFSTRNGDENLEVCGTEDPGTSGSRSCDPTHDECVKAHAPCSTSS